MVQRTTEQWHALFSAQAQSGLSQAQFCKEHGLDRKYFSVRKRQLKWGEHDTRFIRVARAESAPRVTAIEWQLHLGPLQLRIMNAPVEQIVQLLKGLT